jgi:hypothetical protein
MLVEQSSRGNEIFRAAVDTIRVLGYTPVELRAPSRTDVGQLLSSWIVWGGILAEKNLRKDSRATWAKVWNYLSVLGLSLTVLLIAGSFQLGTIETLASIAFVFALLMAILVVPQLPTFSSDLVRITFTAPLKPGEKHYDPGALRRFQVRFEAGRAVTHNWAAKHRGGRSLSRFELKGGDPLVTWALAKRWRAILDNLPLTSLLATQDAK